MKKKEIATALGLSVALTMTTGCASQTDVDALNNQITEMSVQVESLQTELANEQNKSADIQSDNDELAKQISDLESELNTVETELEDAENLIKSADDDVKEMTINVTKYAEDGSTVYSKPEEKEENKIADLEMNTECYVVANFSGLDNEMWSAIGTLKTTDANGDATYQIISSVEKSEEKVNNKNVDFMFRKCESFTVEGKTIKADELGENQEIRIVYARTSLLSNSKVTEQQHTSAGQSSTPKQTPQQSTPTESVPGGWDDLPEVPGVPGCEGCQCIMFH